MTTTEIKTPAPKNITRRQMLQSFAVSSAATLTASIIPASAADPAFVAQELAAPALLELIEQHRRAWAAYGTALDAADSLHPSYGGADAEAIMDILNDAEQEALQNVLTYPVATLADARTKAAHLTQNDYGLDQYDVSAVLASIADQNPQCATLGPSSWALSNHHPVKLGIEELIAAITAETDAFRTAPDND